MPLDAVQLQASFDRELSLTMEQGLALGMVRWSWCLQPSRSMHVQSEAAACSHVLSAITASVCCLLMHLVGSMLALRVADAFECHGKLHIWVEEGSVQGSEASDQHPGWSYAKSSMSML